MSEITNNPTVVKIKTEKPDYNSISEKSESDDEVQIISIPTVTKSIESIDLTDTQDLSSTSNEQAGKNNKEIEIIEETEKYTVPSIFFVSYVIKFFKKFGMARTCAVLNVSEEEVRIWTKWKEKQKKNYEISNENDFEKTIGMKLYSRVRKELNAGKRVTIEDLKKLKADIEFLAGSLLKKKPQREFKSFKEWLDNWCFLYNVIIIYSDLNNMEGHLSFYFSDQNCEVKINLPVDLEDPVKNSGNSIISNNSDIEQCHSEEEITNDIAIEQPTSEPEILDDPIIERVTSERVVYPTIFKVYALQYSKRFSFDDACEKLDIDKEDLSSWLEMQKQGLLNSNSCNMKSTNFAIDMQLYLAVKMLLKGGIAITVHRLTEMRKKLCGGNFNVGDEKNFEWIRSWCLRFEINAEGICQNYDLPAEFSPNTLLTLRHTKEPEDLELEIVDVFSLSAAQSESTSSTTIIDSSPITSSKTPSFDQLLRSEHCVRKNTISYPVDFKIFAVKTFKKHGSEKSCSILGVMPHEIQLWNQQYDLGRLKYSSMQKTGPLFYLDLNLYVAIKKALQSGKRKVNVQNLKEIRKNLAKQLGVTLTDSSEWLSLWLHRFKIDRISMNSGGIGPADLLTLKYTTGSSSTPIPTVTEADLPPASQLSNAKKIKKWQKSDEEEYPLIFKLEVAEYAKSHNFSECSEKYDISPGSIKLWYSKCGYYQYVHDTAVENAEKKIFEWYCKLKYAGFKITEGALRRCAKSAYSKEGQNFEPTKEWVENWQKRTEAEFSYEILAESVPNTDEITQNEELNSNDSTKQEYVEEEEQTNVNFSDGSDDNMEVQTTCEINDNEELIANNNESSQECIEDDKSTISSSEDDKMKMQVSAKTCLASTRKRRKINYRYK